MTQVDARLAEQLERIEAEAWSSNQLAMPDSLAVRLGVDVSRVAGAVALRAAKVDILMLNRVVGLGFQSPLTETLLDHVIAHYRSSAVPRFLISWSPAATPPAAAAWMTARGFVERGAIAKLFLHARAKVSTTTGPSVIEIDASRAAEYGVLVARADDDPPEFASAHAATVGVAGWRHYLAVEDDRAIAGGCMFQRDGIAWCGFAGTLPEHRRKGAQTALLGRRANDAVRAGAELIACETVAETPTRPSPSYRNMIRVGFRQAYLRTEMLYDGTGRTE